MRADLYTIVHKAQRFHLFLLSNEISTADFSNPDDVQRVSTRLRDMIHHLRDHARNEETYIHPLFREIDAAEVEKLEGEHHELETEIEKLERILDEARWSDLYSQYTQFLGSYLVHLAEEETAQKDILWNHYDDPALFAVFNRFKMERSPQAAKSDLELMLPALSTVELARIFSGMKASAPQKVFEGACDLAAHVLEPKKWEELKAAVS